MKKLMEVMAEELASAFEKAGYDVTCIIKGLGELAGIRRIYVRHVKDCIESCLNEH